MRYALLVLFVLGGPEGNAGDVSVLATEFRPAGAGSWQVSATLEHGDTGWEHYADAWRVVSADGTVYGTRVLHHPHETEQPFTRSLGGVKIPVDVKQVFVEAHDKVHGWSPRRLEVELDTASDGPVRVQR